MWIWFNDHVMLFLPFPTGKRLFFKKAYLLPCSRTAGFALYSYETPRAKTKPFLKLSVFASLQTNWIKGTINAIDGKFCWKLCNSCLWPEKAPVQEKLPLTLTVLGAARMGPLEKRTSMKAWIWACKELLLATLLQWKGAAQEMMCLFRVWMNSTPIPLHRGHKTGTVICSVGLQVKNRCTCHFFSFINKENVILAKRWH